MIDLRQLILRIDDNKDIPTHLCLDLDCRIQGDDPKPLIKVINYIVNFLRPLTDQEIQIALDAQRGNFVLAFIAYTPSAEMAPVSTQLSEALKLYEASMQTAFEPGKYIQMILTFPK